MSINRTELRAYPTRVLGYVLLNNLLDKGVDKTKALFTDVVGGGGLFLPAAVTPTSLPGSSVEVAALEGMDTLGNHLRVATTTVVSCVTTYLGESLFAGGVVISTTWIGIFAKFVYTESDAHVVGGTTYYAQRVEAVEFLVVKGTPTQRPSNPGFGSIRICNILLTEGASTIGSGDIQAGFGVAQDECTPIANGYMKKTGGVFTGDIYRNVQGNKMPYLASNQGSFYWGDTYGISDVPAVGDPYREIGFPSWVGVKYSGATINHGLGNVKVAFKALPCIGTTNSVAGQANIESLYPIDDPSGLSVGRGSMWTLQPYPYNGQIIVMVGGDSSWVNYWRWASTGQPRLWTWVAWRVT